MKRVPVYLSVDELSIILAWATVAEKQGEFFESGLVERLQAELDRNNEEE